MSYLSLGFWRMRLTSELNLAFMVERLYGPAHRVREDFYVVNCICTRVASAFLETYHHTYTQSTTMPPTLVLVHGAWHSPKHFEPTTKILVSHGYKVVGVDCPSTNNTRTLSTFEDDCEAVRSAVLRELDTADVLVAAHSYGGAVATSALQGLSSTARSGAGHATSVIGIAYICAAVLPAGITFLDAVGGKSLPIHDLSGDDGFVRVGAPGPEHYFYNDLSSSEAKHWVSLLRPQSWVAVTSGVVTSEACMEVPAHYLFCSKDQALAIEIQKGMVAGAEERSGKSFRTEELECSHSPFLSMPEETAEFLRRSAGEAC